MTTESVVPTGTTDGKVLSVGFAAALVHGMGCFIRGTGRTGIRFRWSIILAVAIFTNQYPFTRSSLIVYPNSAVSMVGGFVIMSCGTDLSDNAVHWEFAPARTNKTSYIYTNRQIPENLTSRYRIDTDNSTRYDIVIASVDWSHAGTYICTPVNATDSYVLSASAQLIVLDSDPVCNTNVSAAYNGSIVEGDYIRIWCTAYYTGNWIPHVDWNITAMQRGKSGQWTVDFNNRSTFSLTMPLSPCDQRVALVCKTSFNPSSTWSVRRPRLGELLSTYSPPNEFFCTVNLSALPPCGDAMAASSQGLTPLIAVIAVGFAVLLSATA